MKTVAPRVVLVALALGAIVPLSAAPGNTKKVEKLKKQILVYAQRKDSGIEYVYSGRHYSGKEL
jgi:hypothetical protein